MTSPAANPEGAATDSAVFTGWEQAKSLRLSGQPAVALELLRSEIKKHPSEFRLHDEMGMAYGELGRQEEAIGAFLTTLRLKPDYTEACSKIGEAFASRGMLEPARSWFERAHREDPDATEFLHHFGVTLVALGHVQEAAVIFDQWTKADPNNQIARHLADAAMGSAAATKAPAGYVRDLFDSYANRFDECLARLHYCGPQIVFETLSRVVASPASGWAVLDAGCGTGLVGALIRPRARHLVGVDLSSAMLDVARKREVYDELFEAEIIDYMSRHEGQFDLVTAADVLIYLGELDEVFKTAAQSLQLGGAIAFTVESLENGQDYRLNPTGRFSHGNQYVCKVMEAAGFEVRHLDNAVVRHEADRPVLSLVAVGVKST